MNLQLNNMEMSVIDMSAEGFSFRLAKDVSKKTDRENCTIFLSVFDFSEYVWNTLQLCDFKIITLEEMEYYNVYKVDVRDEIYADMANMLMKQYRSYVNLKNDYDDAYVSQTLVGYKASVEENYPKNWREQKEQWIRAAVSRAKANSEGFENGYFHLGITLENHYWYNRFLTDDDFMSTYWKENYLAEHPIAKRKTEYVYIGNQYCRFLFPPQICSLLDRAKELDMIPVIQFTDMAESEIEERTAIIRELSKWCRDNSVKLELIVNDIGMMELAEEYDCLVLSKGALLNKCVRDPRIIYKKGMNPVTGIAERRSFAQQFCSNGHDTVWHVPFYQTNTSNFCPIQAQIRRGNRALQQVVDSCGGCRNKTFIYGDGLKMVGKYNSLFGYDDYILSYGEELKNFHGRVIVNMK